MADQGCSRNLAGVTKGLPRNKHVADIFTYPYNDKTVYVVLNGRRDDDHTPYLFVSYDYGSTWTNISYNLPASPVNVFLMILTGAPLLRNGYGSLPL